MNYAGDNEDLLILPYLEDIQVGYAVDVGAADGLFLSNTKFYEDRGWSCLCIEPNPFYYEALSRNRKLVMPYGVSNRNAELVPFNIYEPSPGCYAAGSGFHADLEFLKTTGMPDGALIHSVKVPTRTLDYCLEAAGFPRVDFVSIDTERHEMEVLQGFSLGSRWKPRVVVIEDLAGQLPYAEIFNSRGYQRAHRVAFNDIYVRKEEKP